VHLALCLVEGNTGGRKANEEVVMSKSPGLKHRPLRRDGGDAFFPDPASLAFISLPDAESLAEEFIAAATSADFVFEESRNELSMDEIGGPFLEDEELDLFD
jgi:hypothetical protein